MDKARARERRNRLLESAAAAELSLTEGVREMRAIAGMTQEEFAQHRGVSARVIKAIELGQGNPTVATLNRIGQFFGLEVAFVPVKRPAALLPADTGAEDVNARSSEKYSGIADATVREAILDALKAREDIISSLNSLTVTLAGLDDQLEIVEKLRKKTEGTTGALRRDEPAQEHAPRAITAGDTPVHKKRKPRSS
jgi:transcriptional regulator with XRE-family HTH domain